MSKLIEIVGTDGVIPQVERVSADRLISGDPVHTSWPVEEKDGLYCGIWQSTPGKWRTSYDEWEYCRILEGHARLVGDDGTVTEVRTGESFVIRPGFRGTWEIIETTRKDYVILARP